MTYFLFFLGLVFLIKGADILVDGASAIARKMKVSDMVIGLTIVSFGTSMPELVVTMISNLNGSSDLAIGSVLGSNIANTLLILGVSAIIYTLPINKSTVLQEIPFTLIATLLLGFLANADLFNKSRELSIDRMDGFILLFFFGLFMVYIFQLTKENETPEDLHKADTSVGKSILMVLVGLTGLFFGGKWVVDGAIVFAQSFGMSESFIGLTIVAVGTSLPELVTSAMAAYRKNADIAVGNVVGSNIFNILWILGLSASVKELPFDIISNTDILMIILSSSLLLVCISVGRTKAIVRWQGILFVIIYIGYVAYLVQRG